MADIDQILRRGAYASTRKYMCFLPWTGEFGWYIFNHVKRFQGCTHPNKIACIKPGHECLFPTANHFYYDWIDITDQQKAGVIPNTKENDVKNAIIAQYGTDVEFVSPSETGWEEKLALSGFHFVPKNRNTVGLKVDVVVATRNRQIDQHRNWTKDKWQYVIDGIKNAGLSVGMIGNAETSFPVTGVVKASDYTDIDSDIEMLHSSKVFIGQDSGMLYLAMLCEKPLIVIDNYQGPTSECHRRSEVWLSNDFINKPDLIIQKAVEIAKRF